MTDMTLRARLFGEDVSMGKTFKSAGDDAAAAGRKVDHVGRENLRKFGEFAKGAAKGFGLAAAGIVTAAGGIGLGTAAANEQAEISFTTMLGSGRKAKSFLKELQSFAASTPFEFPELQSAASSLISAGVNANKVIPIMRTLGDVTSGMGTGSEGVKRATIALQQMQAAGRITGEDLNQLRDAGIPVYDLLAKATGKSKAEVVKLAQAGKLGSKELGQMMKALETGKGLERFSGLMDKQSQSLTGLWSTVKDTFGQGLANALQPVIPLIKDGLVAGSQKLAEIMPKVSAALGEFVKGVKNGTGAGGKFRDVVVATGKVISTTTKFVSEHRTLLTGLVAVLGSGLVAFKAITTAVKIYTGVQAALNIMLAANPIGIVIVLLAALVAGLVYAYKHSETFRNIVNRQFDLVKIGALTLASVAVGAFRFLNNAFITCVEVLVTGAAKAFGWVPGLGPKLKAAAANVTTFKNQANTALDKVQKDLQIKANTAKADAAINEMRRRAGKPVTVQVFMQTSYTAGSSAVVKGIGRINAGQRASGGPVKAHLPYIVGEEGPELIYPDQSGMVVNARDTARIMAGGTHRGSAVAGMGGGGDEIRQPIVLQMDGREMWRGLLRVKRETGVVSLGI